VKYLNDFVQHVSESSLEDFISGSEGVVLVSTIHKTKGREFDNVILALSRFPYSRDEDMRAIYVAITRARHDLCIISNGNYFDNIGTGDVCRSYDGVDYPVPNRIMLQLSHKDVDLGKFAKRGRDIDAFTGGESLIVNETGCEHCNKPILFFSASFCKKLEDLKARGYSPAGASVRYIVYWRDSNYARTVKIVLPRIELVK
jgi:ATP-dependent DNA helicase RecQ